MRHSYTAVSDPPASQYSKPHRSSSKLYFVYAWIRYTETDKWREKIMADLKLHHGSIFEKISIVEMGILVLLSQVASCSA